MKQKLIVLLTLCVMLPCLSSCRQTASHCYLCQGVPRSIPCVVDLSTGDVSELSPGGYGNIAFSTIGGVTVIGNNSETCTATLPAMGEDMDPALFCDDCQELISHITNTGYILADLRDISDISLYPIVVGVTLPIGDYILSVAEGDNGSVRISSYKSDN